MNQVIKRASDRLYDQVRDIKISYNVFGYAASSVLFEQGNTKVFCAVTMQPGVPPFLKGTKAGWLTAEYAMLPTSTHNRLMRDSNQAKKNERAVEISRLIGRTLRSIVDLSSLGERTIFIDCDVLQADGSTRTASITGASIALKIAVSHWLETGELVKNIVTDSVAAVSAGFLNGVPLLDLDYSEDSAIDADYNFVFTNSQKIVEIQGTSEKNALSLVEFDQLKSLAIKGTQNLFEIIDRSANHTQSIEIEKKVLHKKHNTDVPLFSLKNRLANAV